MKANCIQERPIIVISQNVNRWRMFKKGRGKKETIYFTKASDWDTVVKLKPETCTTGVFKVYSGYSIVTCKGKVVSSWQLYQFPEPAEFSNIDEISKILKKKKLFGSEIYVQRTVYTYTNSVTKDSTRDIEVAKAWFPDQDPLWIPENKGQTVGVWIEPKKDHIEVEVWYNNGITKKEVLPWIKPLQAGFWLYPDGTISHFWRGKYYSDRVFEEKRMTYHTFDVRFAEMLSGQYNFIDLRSPEIDDGSRDRFNLSEDTLKLIKKAGFKSYCWAWGSDTNRKLKRVWDLFDMIKYKQKSELSKKGSSLHDQIQDIPFDINNPVMKINGGILIRIPRVQEIYTTNQHIETGYSYVGCNSKLVDIRIIECARIWIKDNCSEITCFNSIHLGKNWATCSSSEVDFPHYQRALESKEEYNQNWSQEQNDLYRECVKSCRSAMAHIAQEVLDNLPYLSYYKTELQGYDWPALWSFICAVKKAPSLVDTFVKQGLTSLIQNRNYCYDYCDGYHAPHWDVEHVLRTFGLTVSEYKERKGKKLWNNLKLTKDQFQYALDHTHVAEHLYNNLKTAFVAKPATVGVPMYDKDKFYYSGDIVQYQGYMYKLYEGYEGDHRNAPIFEYPETSNFYHPNNPWELITYPRDRFGTIISHIPMKYIEMLGSLYEDTLGRGNEYSIRQMVFPREKPVSLVEVETYKKRGLNLSVLADYWNILSNMRYYGGNSDNWERIPRSQEELQQLHNEANIRVELLREERRQQWEKERKEQEVTRATRYQKYLKMLQDFAKEDDKFTVVIPQKLSEIVDEGAAMHHCVGSYTGQVSNGETFVFFLRKKENPEQCYVTFNIVPAQRKRSSCTHKWCMDQAFASYDRKPKKEAIEFIREWAEEKDVEFSTILRSCI